MKFITREQWGARKPKSVTALPMKNVDAIVIHYTAAFKDELPPYYKRVQETQNYHMDTKGWNDIAYNFLTARDGTVFEGRGYNVQSASTMGANNHILSICFLGADSATRDDVTPEGRTAIGEMIKQIEVRKGSKLPVKGHRDYKKVDPADNTACPGDELYHYIQLKGWENTGPVPLPAVPSWFYTWAAWYLGEGRFKPYGKANKAHRPKNVPAVIPKKVWAALVIFIANRKVK